MADTLGPKDRIEAELWACQKGMLAHEYDSPEWRRFHDIQQAIMWVIDPSMCAPPTIVAFRDRPHPYLSMVSNETIKGEVGKEAEGWGGTI